jgi:Cellulose-binding protein Sde0182, C-terminal domain/Cellulose-binding Sde182, nucleoside hydrolase-like domain
MEGDTPSFLGLIDNGLNAYRRPDWGGWGGRYIYRQPHGETHPFWTQGGDEFMRLTSQDTVTGSDGREYTSDQATIWRWREALQNDFAARMSWTIEDFAHANHNPQVVINEQAGTAPIVIDAEVGSAVQLDASQTRDPDGNQLQFKWFHYAEAGTMDANHPVVTLSSSDPSKITVTATSICKPLWLPIKFQCIGPGTAHIILAVTDNGSPNLTSYRRVLLTVHPKAQP